MDISGGLWHFVIWQPWEPGSHKRVNLNIGTQAHIVSNFADNWSAKAKRRKTTGTGRMRYLKHVSRRFDNGFRTGQPKNARGPLRSAAAAAASAPAE